jgi:ubiquinone/menaquinone biosynthesis C-methylase UbiE
MHSRPVLIGLLLLSLYSAVLHAQSAGTPAVPSQQSQRKTSTPYSGDLTIFESPGRDKRLQIDRVMDILGISPGKSVADIGAGSGWFSTRAASRVGKSGTVFAVDINPAAIRYIDDRIRKEKLHNVQAVLSKPDDPMLPRNSVNSVLILKTYHEFEHPVALLQNLRASLRPGARVGIIERNGNGEDHGVARDVVIREVTSAGYQLAQQLEWKHDGMDYFVVFTLPQ